MKAWMILILVMAVSLFVSNSYGGTPFEFPKTGDMFIAQIGDEHYLAVEELSFNGTGLWAVWKLNKSNGIWELFSYGEPEPGKKSASGKYVYLSSKEILIWEIDFSLFLGCNGPHVGTSVFSSALSEPSLRLTPIEVGADDESTLVLTRVSGTPGQIQGQWSMNLGSNSFLLDLNADNTLYITGDVEDCQMD